MSRIELLCSVCNKLKNEDSFYKLQQRNKQAHERRCKDCEKNCCSSCHAMKADRASFTFKDPKMCDACLETKRLNCSLCGMTKNLTCFATKQRRRKEKSRCRDCTSAELNNKRKASDEKREKAISERKKRKDEKRARLETASLNCSSCDMTKNLTCFAQKQRSKEKPRCRDCTSTDHGATNNKRKASDEEREKAVSERKKRKNEKRARERKAAQEEERARREERQQLRLISGTEKKDLNRMGLDFYENLVDKLGTKSFKTNIDNEREKILGTHDILYCAYRYKNFWEFNGEPVDVNRTIKGTLNLSWKGTNSSKKKEKILQGDVKIDPKYKPKVLDKSMAPLVSYDGEFSFEQFVGRSNDNESDDDEEDWSIPICPRVEDGRSNLEKFIPLEITKCNHASEPEERLPGGNISIVAKRFALGRRIYEDYCYPVYDDFQEKTRKHRDDIEFSSLEEAKKIDEKARNLYKESWLCKHKSLPESVAQVIHEYVSCQPKPVFFVEEGDICIQVTWEYSEEIVQYDTHPNFTRMVLIARRRGQSRSQQ